MIHFTCKNLAIIFICLNALGFAACQPEPVGKSENRQIKNQLKTETNSFFSEAVLQSDSAPDEEVPCPGATQKEINDPNHRQIVRGSVVAPRIRAAFGFPFINQAHAVPIAGEFPVSNVKVSIMEGLDNPKMVSETTTDALGRFCLKLSGNNTFNKNYYIEAQLDKDRIRRLSPTQKVAILSTQSEAVFRLYKRNHKRISATRSTAINLQTIADTQVDTLNPVHTQSTIEKTISLLIQNLEADQRVRKCLQLE